MNPLKRLSALFDKLGARALRNDESMVRGPATRPRYLRTRGVVVFIAAVAALLVYPHVESGVLSMMLAGFLGGVIGASAFTGIRRAQAYQFGWLDGRRAMFNALHEAMQRDMSLVEWARAELARDMSIIGVDPSELESLPDDDE